MPLRVMSYNVRYFGHGLRGASATRAGVRKIAAAIATLPHLPDVICLQEVERRSLRARLSLEGKDDTQLETWTRALDQSLAEAKRADRYVPHYFPAHVYGIGAARLYTTGLAVLVHRDLEVIDTNSDAPMDITHRGSKALAKLKQSRICAHVRLLARTGEIFDVFNTHLSLPSFASKEFYTSEARMGYAPNQLLEVDRLVRFIAETAETERFALVGDFNSLPGSPVYEKLLRELPLADPHPVVSGLTPRQLRETWPTAGFMHLRMRLDHLLLGHGVRALDLDDSHPFGHREGRWHGLSDHVPLLGRVKIR